MTVVINGTTGITNDGGYTGDGVVFADTTPANTLVTTTGGNVGIGTSSPNNYGSAYRVLQASASDSGIIQVTGTTNSVTNEISTTGTIGQVGTRSNHALAFKTNDTERARIDSSGNLLVGTTTAYAKFTLVGANGIYLSEIAASSAGTAYFFNFVVNNPASRTQVGNIITNGTSTSYNTTSDYRLKESVAPMTGALAKVAALKPVTYKWKVNGSDGEGFIAHELQAVVPDAVSGEKDAVNEDGSLKPQSIDTSFLVATLTAAIQEQQAIINALTARVEALEGKANV